MKGTAIVILFILAAFSGANASRVNAVDAASSTTNPSWWAFRWPWSYNPFPPSADPNNQQPLFDPNILKCLGDLVSGAAATSCFQQISKSYDSQTISLSPTCCAAVQQLNADCSSTVFSIFNNPFFQYAIKQCSATP
ncbi:uncharacterized protein LOC116116230 [Pistacia vera]|uniref:uncharacterized protein LOC116116230 n=1 Tax=Pistacia vera TaxID=55513 RepID=UPI001262B6B5|nr:uncharacterized protein LOC116116230 [Pistacia vera]